MVGASQARKTNPVITGRGLQLNLWGGQGPGDGVQLRGQWLKRSCLHIAPPRKARVTKSQVSFSGGWNISMCCEGGPTWGHGNSVSGTIPSPRMLCSPPWSSIHNFSSSFSTPIPFHSLSSSPLLSLFYFAQNFSNFLMSSPWFPPQHRLLSSDHVKPVGEAVRRAPIRVEDHEHCVCSLVPVGPRFTAISREVHLSESPVLCFEFHIVV